MIKSLIQQSIHFLLQKPKIIRLSFLTTFGHTIMQIYITTYFFVSIITSRYETGVDTSTALLYLVNKIQELEIWQIIIPFLLIIVIWYAYIHHIGNASLIYYIQNEGKKLFNALHKGIQKFFPMFGSNALFGMGLGLRSVSTYTIRLGMMNLLDNIIIKIIVIIRRIIALFIVFFAPYVKYYITIHNMNVFDAFKKSISLTLGNFGLTIKGVLFEMLLFIRFFVNTFIVIAVPLFLIFLAVQFKVIENAWIENIIRIISLIVLAIITYINAIFEAFFTTYRYKIFQLAEKNLNEE